MGYGVVSSECAEALATPYSRLPAPILNTSDRLHVVSSKMKTTDSRLVWDSTYPLTLYIVDEIIIEEGPW